MLQAVRRGHEVLKGHPCGDLQAVVGAMGVGVHHVRKKRQLDVRALRAGPFVLLDDDPSFGYDVSFAEAPALIGEGFRRETVGHPLVHAP